MDDRRPVLVGRPVRWPMAGVPEPPVDPAWEILPCDKCGCDVYVLPADLSVAQSLGNPAVVCSNCVANL